MKKFSFGIALIILIGGCATKSPQPQPSSNNTVEEKEKPFFFPVTSFIRGEMRQFDSLKLNPLYTITVNGKTDSTCLKLEQLKPSLTQFLTPEIDSASLAHYFRETRFNDRTINTITFTYDRLDMNAKDTFQLQSCNVYVDPETGIVTKIYLVKQARENNQLISYQLTWNAGKWAKINSLLNKENGETILLKEEKYTWDLSE